MTLLEDIEKFLERHSLSATALGQNALGDRHFVRQLRAGRDVRMSTVERVRKFMADCDRSIAYGAADTAIPEKSPTGQSPEMSGHFSDAAGEAA